MKPVYRVMTVCTGNICRSPMAEVVLRERLEAAGLGDAVVVDSTGTSDEEHGRPVDRRAHRVLTAHGYSVPQHRARQVTPVDLPARDLLLPMTATHAPAGTAAVLSTAPTPVVTQQPIRAATAGSVPSGMGIAAAAGTTLASAMVAMAQYERTSRNAVSPSSRVCRYDGESGHAQVCPRRHERHTPHGMSHDKATS